MTGKYLEYIQENWKKIGFLTAILLFMIVLEVFFLNSMIRSDSLKPHNETNEVQVELNKTVPDSHPLPPLDKTLFVAGDGSGNYNCNGSDDQVAINQAFEYAEKNPQFTTVYLKGNYTYIISDSIVIGNNITLEGDPTAVIKLKDSAGWPVGKALIVQKDRNGINGVNITGFEIFGNYENNLDKPLGYGYYIMILFRNATNFKVYNMYMHDGHGEAVRVENGSDIQFYNNTVYKSGHNALFVDNCQNIEAWNNRITVRTDCGLKASNSNHVKFHDNYIDSFYHWSAGGPGIMIAKSTGIVDDVEIYNNTIEKTYGPGLWLLGSSKSYPRDEAKNVHIYRNVFHNTGTNPSIDWVGGIVTSGFYDTLIENNTFDGCYHAAIAHMIPTGENLHVYPTDVGKITVNLTPKDTGYSTIVRNNIIANTQLRKKDPDGTGYGVINYIPENSSIVLEHNCLYNNLAGDYKNCGSTTDIYEDPVLLNGSIGAGYNASSDSSAKLPKNMNRSSIKSIFKQSLS